MRAGLSASRALGGTAHFFVGMGNFEKMSPCSARLADTSGLENGITIVCLGICSEFHCERCAAVQMYEVGLIIVLNGMAHFILVVDSVWGGRPPATAE